MLPAELQITAALERPSQRTRAALVSWLSIRSASAAESPFGIADSWCLATGWHAGQTVGATRTRNSGVTQWPKQRLVCRICFLVESGQASLRAKWSACRCTRNSHTQEAELPNRYLHRRHHAVGSPRD